jgi:hypothetical protein
MVLHTLIAGLLVGALGMAYQGLREGDANAGSTALLAALWPGPGHDDHHKSDD